MAKILVCVLAVCAMATVGNSAIIQYEVGGAQTDSVDIPVGGTVSVTLRVIEPSPGFSSADVLMLESATASFTVSNVIPDPGNAFAFESYQPAGMYISAFDIFTHVDAVLVTFDFTLDTPGQVVLGAAGYGLPGMSKIGRDGTLLEATILPLTIIIPEPATLALLATGSLALIRRRPV